ncbi:MAG: hypothetical protein HY820_00115 [Acidobacteria bacterium]|nr:hypothetical protein [Acidobacteriota bacterium]
MQLGAVQTQNSVSTSPDRPKDLKQAAEAFEGLFLAMLLKTARQASQAEGGPDRDGAADTVLEMAEEHMATQIAKGRGCGFAAAMLKQIAPQYAEGATASKDFSVLANKGK